MGTVLQYSSEHGKIKLTSSIKEGDFVRIKTESKRLELLVAATDVFLEQGFERTLMSHISERAKCSKGTLYSYFASKEELFFEVVICGTQEECQGLFVELSSPDDAIADTLLKFGVRFLNTLYAPRFQALRRLAFSESASVEVRRGVYENGIKHYELQVAALISEAIQQGKLIDVNSSVAAAHLCGLLESELLLKFLLGALETPTPETLTGKAKCAVQAFISAYGK